LNGSLNVKGYGKLTRAVQFLVCGSKGSEWVSPKSASHRVVPRRGRMTIAQRFSPGMPRVMGSSPRSGRLNIKNISRPFHGLRSP